MSAATTANSGPSPTSFAAPRSWHPGDRVFALLCQSAGVFVILLFVSLVGVLVWQSWHAIETIGLQFFVSTSWDPEPTHREFGALAFIYGTLATSFFAML